MGAVAKESLTHPKGTSTFSQDKDGNVKITRKYKKKSNKGNRWYRTFLNLASDLSPLLIFIIPLVLAIAASWIGGLDKNKRDTLFGISMAIYCCGFLLFGFYKENNSKNQI